MGAFAWLHGLDQKLIRRFILGRKQTPGRLTRFSGGSFYALPDTVYFAERIELTGKKILCLEGKIPRARFWSITFYDRIGRPVESLIDEEIPTSGETFSIRIGNVPREEPGYVHLPRLTHGMVIMRVVRPDPAEELEAPHYHYEDP